MVKCRPIEEDFTCAEIQDACMTVNHPTLVVLVGYPKRRQIATNRAVGREQSEVISFPCCSVCHLDDLPFVVIGWLISTNLLELLIVNLAIAVSVAIEDRSGSLPQGVTHRALVLAWLKVEHMPEFVRDVEDKFLSQCQLR